MKAEVIHDTVNDFLEELQVRREEFSGEAINWADLKCTSVERIEDLLYGEERLVVTIEEAAPGCRKLSQAVEGHLTTLGITAKVVSEW